MCPISQALPGLSLAATPAAGGGERWRLVNVQSFTVTSKRLMPIISI